MQDVNKRLLDAAKLAKPALDLYKAYGWSDRNDVIGRLESAIAAAEQAQQALPEKVEVPDCTGYDLGNNFEIGYANGWNDCIDSILSAHATNKEQQK